MGKVIAEKSPIAVVGTKHLMNRAWNPHSRVRELTDYYRCSRSYVSRGQ